MQSFSWKAYNLAPCPYIGFLMLMEKTSNLNAVSHCQIRAQDLQGKARWRAQLKEGNSLVPSTFVFSPLHRNLVWSLEEVI